MREKRYSKGMKGTQGKEEERYPFLDVFPLKRKAIREINERVGGFEEAYMELLEDGAITEYVNMLELYFFGKSYSEPEEKKAKEKEIIREVFAEAGLELEETERGNYTMAFSIKGKLII
nr:MAG: hypothetical protein [Bacteriophage sp.]